MHSRRVKISVSLPRDLVARIDRTARVEARSRSRVVEPYGAISDERQLVMTVRDGGAH
jgi:metal-responsive CopG/Arc/MetJ family transcriptional regulator